MRLDKLLAHAGFGSRKDVKALIKNNRVCVDDKVIKDSSYHVDPFTQHIQVNQQTVHYKKFVYVLMHKTKGIVSATTNAKDKTVIDVLPEKWRKFDPFPVGRLDKNTEGLLFITNDGEIAHYLTSPKNEIKKTYYAKVKGEVTEEDIKVFQKGVVLDDGYKTKGAQLKIIKSATISEIELTITEGKFHQVKRMFATVGKKVIYLKRIRMGEFILEDTLKLGEIRELNTNERAYLNRIKMKLSERGRK